MTLCALPYCLTAILALALRLPWPACVAVGAALAQGSGSWMLRAGMCAAAAWALLQGPFSAGQMLLSDVVLPFSLVAFAPLISPLPASWRFHAWVALSASVCLMTASRHADASSEVAAAIVLALGSILGRAR